MLRNLKLRKGIGTSGFPGGAVVKSLAANAGDTPVTTAGPLLPSPSVKPTVVADQILLSTT